MGNNTLKAEKSRTRISINSRPIWKNENPDELAKLKPELKKKNKRKKPKKPKKLLENKLKPKLKPPEKKAEPPILFQTKISTRELTNRKLTAGTVRSVIFTLKCTETSCKQRKYKKQ